MDSAEAEEVEGWVVGGEEDGECILVFGSEREGGRMMVEWAREGMEWRGRTSCPGSEG